MRPDRLESPTPEGCGASQRTIEGDPRPRSTWALKGSHPLTKQTGAHVRWPRPPAPAARSSWTAATPRSS